MRDMHALRTKLPRQTLRHGAQGELHGCEGGEERGAFYGGGGAGEEEGGGVRGGGGGEEEGEGGLREVEGAFAGGDVSFSIPLICVYIMGGQQDGANHDNSHTPRITSIQPLPRQLQKRLPHKRPARIEHRRRTPHLASKFLLHGFHHRRHAACVRDIGGDPDGASAGCVYRVDDGGVGAGGPREERDGVGEGEFSGDGGAGLGGWLVNWTGGREGRGKGRRSVRQGRRRR